MKKKIIISTIVAFLISCWLSPPDLLSALTYGVGSALLCCIPLLILARRKFVKSSPNSMHTLVCILVCMVSVLSVQWSPWLRFQQRIADNVNWSPDFSSVSSSTSFHVGSLWIVHSSNRGGFWSKETECVICSVDPPKSSRHGESTWMLTFSDGNSVEVKIKKDETVWIDEQHRVTFLGPILNKEDVSLLRNHRYDEEFKILSPEELLEIVKRLKENRVAAPD